jgi:hypothetical protein
MDSAGKAWMVGGMARAPILILITLPVLISLFSRNYRRSIRAEPISEPPA